MTLPPPLRLAVLTLWGLPAVTPAFAHDLAFTDARLAIVPGGRFVARLTVDLDALALGVDPATDAPAVVAAIQALPPAEREALLARLRELLGRRVRVRFDGTPAGFDVAFPDRAPDPAAVPLSPTATVFGLTAELAGPVPPGSRAVTFWASRAFPPVRLSVSRPGGEETVRFVLPGGEESPPVELRGVARVRRGEAVLRYLRLGFWHIVPEGTDHVLFVLGLFLLSPRVRPLLVQVSAFTAAHTATLALSTLGLLRLPSPIVEPLIALSIAWVGVENTLARGPRPWRTALVFGFGLLHGLGFAGALGELGLPEASFLAALLAFNVGVELGQLAVLAGAFLALGALRDRPWYRRAVAVPLSVGVAGAGLYWTAVRTLG